MRRGSCVPVEGVGKRIGAGPPRPLGRRVERTEQENERRRRGREGVHAIVGRYDAGVTSGQDNDYPSNLDQSYASGKNLLARDGFEGGRGRRPRREATMSEYWHSKPLTRFLLPSCIDKTQTKNGPAGRTPKSTRPRLLHFPSPFHCLPLPRTILHYITLSTHTRSNEAGSQPLRAPLRPVAHRPAGDAALERVGPGGHGVRGPVVAGVLVGGLVEEVGELGPARVFCTCLGLGRGV